MTLLPLNVLAMNSVFAIVLLLQQAALPPAALEGAHYASLGRPPPLFGQRRRAARFTSGATGWVERATVRRCR